MYRILTYRGTHNLGDAIQTYAMARLLGGPLSGVYRDAVDSSRDPHHTFVVNGWIGEKESLETNVLFAGAYIGKQHARQIAWMRRSRFTLGCRDRATCELLQTAGIQAKIIGCATMTLPRYEGARKGVVHVDSRRKETKSGEFFSNSIASRLSWEEQWRQAEQLLLRLRTAKRVYTTRLHVALPCLAFGTPVYVPRRALHDVFQPQRLQMLVDLGVRFGVPFTMDLSEHAARFIDFLSTELRTPIVASDSPSMPKVGE